MLILDDTDRSLQFDLGGAVNATELDVVASFVDIAAPDTYEPATAHTTSNGSSAVTIVPAPAAGRRRQLKFLSIHNGDSQANTARLFLDVNGTERDIVAIALPISATLLYTDGEGFRVIDGAGNILVTANP